MNVGDIHWVELQGANGHEQHGRRPAIIAQNDGYGGDLPTTLVIPLSSARAALRFAGTTLIRATAQSGLRVDSIALVFQIRVIDRTRIGGRLGSISDVEADAVFGELDKLVSRKK